MREKTQTSARQNLAANLKTLLEASKMTGPELAKKAGVDRKSVNNMLNARFNPILDNVEAIANVFGLMAWQLLMPDLRRSLPKADELRQLLDRYYSATDEGRRVIMLVADMSGTYKTLTP